MTDEPQPLVIITEPGVYRNLGEDDYHGDPVPETSLSVSGAKRILQSPARFRHVQLNPEVKKAFDFGHAAHAEVLGVGAPVAVIPDSILASNGAVSTKDAKAFVAEARAAGQVPLKSDEAAVIAAMAAKLREHPLAKTLFADGEPEVSLFTRDAATKVMLRGRLDWRTEVRRMPVVVDYKTTAKTADPSLFWREATDRDYVMQDCWYRELSDAELHPGQPHAFVFCVQEKDPPYLVSFIEFDDDAREIAAQRNRVARELYLDCMTRDDWPGYAPVVHRISTPYARYAPEVPAA